MNLKNLFLTSLLIAIPSSAQTLRVVQLPPNQSVVTLGTKPPIEYRLSLSGDAVSVTLVRFGIYPLWPLTTEDIGEVQITKGIGSGLVLAKGTPTKRDNSALDMTIQNSFLIGNRSEEALLFNITPKPGRPEGVIVIKLEEVVSVGDKTQTVEVLLGNERFTVAIRLPATALRPTIRREGVPPSETITIRWGTEQEKLYQLETTSFFSRWSPVASMVSGTGGEVRLTLPVTYDQTPHFFRVAVTQKPVPSAPPPVVQPPPIQHPLPIPPTPPPPPSGQAGFGYSGEPKPGEPSFGYP